MDKKLRIVIWILIGSCVLNLIFALNAGQKRKIALSKSDTLDARLNELELRYRNAVQSYDDVDKDLRQAKKELEEQKIFSETLKESLQNEQKKSAALQQEYDKLKSSFKPILVKPAVKPEDKIQKKSAPVANIIVKPQDKKTDRSTKRW